ncbi:T9SS type A sorting domain-containing protein [Adhaeribacter terreus]|uniref:T9SS type A sorting domain-containing protein n=1 Tax=Adhaeribacter terreus TaxID=529703 RepID=A0ABW0EC95_9BACT
MKKIFTLLLAMVAASGTILAQNSGGPDAYGYTWKDNTAAGGPTYNWINIIGKTGTTQITGLGDDNSVGMIPLGFTMKYYWVDVNSIKIGSNGWISFSNVGNIAHGFPNIPQGGSGSNFVAPFLADLTLEAAAGATNPGSVYMYTNNVDTAIVSYVNVPFWQSAAPEYIGSNTFQVIFTKADNGIKFQYNTMNPVIPNLTANFNDAVVGIENITETIGLQVMADQMPTSNTAIKFERPANSTYQVSDVKANWVNNSQNGAFTALKGQAMNLTANVANVGNVNIASPISSRLTITKPGNGTYNQTVSLPKLRVGTDTAHTFATPFTPNIDGTYSIQHNVTLTGDVNSSNNLNVTELVVVDTVGRQEVALSYNNASPEGLTSFGAAVFYPMPFFPTEVRSIDFDVLGDQGATVADNGFIVRIYGESATGGLGALLFDTTLAAADVLLNTNNLIEIPQKQYYMITSGGVYVMVIPDVPAGVDQNAFLLVDEEPPFSFRTFEVQNGTLTQYRTADTEDFMINISIGTKILSPMGVSKDRNSVVGLSNIYPNPASNSATLTFDLKQPVAVELTVTNIIGAKVKTLNLGKQTAGSHEAKLNISDLNAGVYICTLKAGETVVTKRLVVTK